MKKIAEFAVTMSMRKTRGMRHREKAGRAGLLVTFAMAFAGIGVGALSAYLSNMGAIANASRDHGAIAELRDGAPLVGYEKRIDQVAQILRDHALERLPVPLMGPLAGREPGNPKVYVIIDDMGLNTAMASELFSFPGPITASFLPYARSANKLAAEARAAGFDVMLHLPMQPVGEADPGPHALRTDMTATRFIRELEWNLSQFDGYIGVNNHMGSKLTSDIASMKTVLGYLADRDLFFLDSVTTGESVSHAVADSVGATVFARDVFIDAEVGSVEAVKDQLALAEKIARKTGFVILIGHPRKETLAALGPWLTSAPARGFDLVPVSDLLKSRAPAPMVEGSDPASVSPSLRG